MKNIFTILMGLGYGAYKQNKSVNKVVNELRPYFNKMCSKEGITVSEFFKAYDICLYDIDNKEEDIKFLKKFDQRGVYLLHNHDKDCYFVGESNHIFQKINQHFKGQGNSAVYQDWKKGELFTIQVILLRNTKFNNIDDLKKEIKKMYIPYIF